MKGRSSGSLWNHHDKDTDSSLSLWKAFLIAFIIEFVIPILFFGFDWSLEFKGDKPDNQPLISVKLEDVILEKEQTLPEQEEEKESKAIKKIEEMEQILLEPIEPLDNEVVSKIALPEFTPEMPKEEVQPELPPLPSVFQDIKPVKKVKPKYPRDAEERKIEGRVKVRMKVRLDGTVSDVTLIYAEPEGVFEKVVIEAAEKFVFKRDGTTYHADEVFVFIIDP